MKQNRTWNLSLLRFFIACLILCVYFDAYDCLKCLQYSAERVSFLADDPPEKLISVENVSYVENCDYCTTSVTENSFYLKVEGDCMPIGSSGENDTIFNGEEGCIFEKEILQLNPENRAADLLLRRINLEYSSNLHAVCRCNKDNCNPFDVKYTSWLKAEIQSRTPDLVSCLVYRTWRPILTDVLTDRLAEDLNSGMLTVMSSCYFCRTVILYADSGEGFSVQGQCALHPADDYFNSNEQHVGDSFCLVNEHWRSIVNNTLIDEIITNSSLEALNPEKLITVTSYPYDRTYAVCSCRSSECNSFQKTEAHELIAKLNGINRPVVSCSDHVVTFVGDVAVDGLPDKYVQHYCTYCLTLYHFALETNRTDVTGSCAQFSSDPAIIFGNQKCLTGNEVLKLDSNSTKKLLKPKELYYFQKELPSPLHDYLVCFCTTALCNRFVWKEALKIRQKVLRRELHCRTYMSDFFTDATVNPSFKQIDQAAYPCSFCASIHSYQYDGISELYL